MAGNPWTEGPDCGGPFGPYTQSQRRDRHLKAWNQLRESGMIYPCTCSRKDVAQSASAPNDADDEPLYPGHVVLLRRQCSQQAAPAGVNWRFRVPDGEVIRFTDLHLGAQSMIAGTRLWRFHRLAAR